MAIYNIPHLSQVQFWYRAKLASDFKNSTSESLEIKLFDIKEIPWSEFAFPSTKQATQYFLAHPDDNSVHQLVIRDKEQL